MKNIEEKKIKLSQIMKEYAREDVCVAFSGGVDSSLLLKLAVEAGEREGTKVYGVTFDTVLHPKADLETAKTIAAKTGAEHRVIFLDELSNPDILDNPPNRCYLCKKMLFQQLLDLAEDLGISKVLEGTNEDDLHQYRPGLKAVQELNIHSPLAMCGFTKEEVREYAAELGISSANRPATPCMATRLPYGTRISVEVLTKIEEGEEYLRSLGFYNVRLRVHNDLARIEVDQKEFPKFMEIRENITERISALGFSYITMDLKGFRSGSMDEKIKEKNI